MTHKDDPAEGFDTLEDLIQYLEGERDRLKAVVEDAAREWEFSVAKSHAKAYGQVFRRLEVLKGLRDPGYEKRAHYYRRMVSLEDHVREHQNVPKLAKRYEQELAEVNRVLDELEKTRHVPIDTQYIDDALFDLVDGAIAHFTLRLSKDSGLILYFECEANTLCIRFLYNKGVLWPSMKKGLRRLGFRKVEGAREFTRDVEVTAFNSAQPIKRMLAVLVFDVFGPGWIDHPMEMEVRR
jgi:hypothetical protein